ncbi:unnamed protein product [Mycena citricolor]|uniref:WD40 repeat-like protein n=1 Tax=Mycena citricolor TaxID=2018698 RepID=A0AAD2K576_9AGAR|nr:unnamed protein product [Mycena citricolor]
MDSRPNPPTLQELFSRGSTPPVPTQPSLPPFGNSNASSSQIDSLFQQLTASAPEQTQSEGYHSGPATPGTSNDEQPASTSSVPNSNADRQSALLSLLSGQPNPRPAPPPNPQQVPTPPSASSRSGTSPTHNETQGKILLEQLMSGNPPMSSYSDSQRSMPAAGHNPSPPFSSSSQGEYRSYQQESSPDLQQRVQAPPAQSQQQAQPPSPRKSMFDFVSPFDALSATATASTKKKAVPPSVSSGTEESSWTNLSDPKRQSVENLLDHLARSTASQMTTSQMSVAPSYGAPAYESYLAGSDFSQSDPAPPPSRHVLPPAPAPKVVANRPASPRAPSPKSHPQRGAVRTADSPAGSNQTAGSNNRRDKESSPGPRGGYKKGTGQGKAGKNQSPVPPPQTIIFDVAQPLDEIQASRDAVKSTAIALVKQDSVFLPGTTIGATHWVAYAMTRGRVRVISRSSGDRTLLQLPPGTFPISSSVSDMAVHGNRLAGVTADGGFVVWELPELITDDVPGRLLLCIAPDGSMDPLLSVKWHPREPDTLAIASSSKLYLIDLGNLHSFHGQTISQSDLPHISSTLNIPSPLIAFDFDILNYTIATISVDSNLIVWNIHDRVPYTHHTVRGEDLPSSLTYVDGGIVVGRKNGTIFQLLSMTSKSLLSTFKFVNSAQEDPDMFGHASYDARIQTLWVANCRRDSMIGLKLHLEPSSMSDSVPRYIDQVIEFPGPKSTIHFVILTADADPNGDEAHAACVAAKWSGPDPYPQGMVRQCSFVGDREIARLLVTSRAQDPPAAAAAAHQAMSAAPTAALLPPVAPMPVIPPARMRTPPSEDGEADVSREIPEPKGRKGKNVNWKEKEKDEGNNGKASGKLGSDPLGSDSVGPALAREMRKMEESLHTRLGRLIGKELDKQNQRLDEARAHDQSEDFTRQETILKLISTELTRNTTRVVEMAVKSEIQASVLPALESITKTEVKATLNDRVNTGFVDYINQSLPKEMENLLTRPDISSHFAKMLSSSLTPMIDRHIKDAVNKSLIPAFSQQSAAMHQDLLREVRTEIHSVRTELTSWQGDAFRNQEASIRELEHTVRALAEQVKFLTINTTGAAASSMPIHSYQDSPGLSVQHIPVAAAQYRQAPSYGPQHFQQAPPPPQGPPPMQQQWFNPPPIVAPQASHPPTMPQAPQSERTPPMKADQWDEMYLSCLHTQDQGKLRELLAHSNPDVVMPLNGIPLVSQPVILTIVARLASEISESSPSEESFKNALWWLQRSSTLIRPEDKLIIDFIPRVVPAVQKSLVTAKQRLALAPVLSSLCRSGATLVRIESQSTHAPYIFNGLAGLLTQWSNTLHPNGHSIVPGTLHPFTTLYHAREDPDFPPSPEWLAWDPEMSFGIMAPRAGETHLLTFRTTAEANVVYFDGMSAAWGPGWLDSQHMFIYGAKEGREKDIRLFDDYERADRLCEWAKLWDIDGIVRMNAGFELIWCDFSSPKLQLVSRLNITPPDTSPRRSRPDIRGRDLSFDTNSAPDWPDISPLAQTSTLEWIRAAARRAVSKQPHITLQTAGLVSFYNPRLTSLAPTGPMHSHRSFNISRDDAQRVVRDVEEALHSLRKGKGSGLDWGAAASGIVEYWGDRTIQLHSLLTNATEIRDDSTLPAIRRLAYTLLNPFMPAGDTPRAAGRALFFEGVPISGFDRCKFQATDFLSVAAVKDRMTSSEELLQDSVEAVLERLCHDFGIVFSESYDLKELTTAHIERWRGLVKSLMDWLDWTVWLRCEDTCPRDHICSTALWPIAWIPWWPWGPPPEDYADKTRARCIKMAL